MDPEAKRRELQQAARKFWAEAKPYIVELRALRYTEPEATDKAKQRWRALWKPIEAATQEAEGTLAKWEAALSDHHTPAFERKVGRYGGQWRGRARAKTAAELAAEVTAAQPEIAARAREARAVLAILANARKARERADAEGAKAYEAAKTDRERERRPVSSNAKDLLDWINKHVGDTRKWPTYDDASPKAHMKRETIAKLARELRDAGYCPELPPKWGRRRQKQGEPGN